MFERTGWLLFGGKAAQIFAILSLCIAIGAVELSEEQHEKLPDFGNPKIAKRLRCSACRGSAVEYHDALRELRAFRKKAKIKDFEYTEALDPVCEKRASQYGLQLRSNFPTEKFSKDKAISRAQGNWAGKHSFRTHSINSWPP